MRQFLISITSVILVFFSPLSAKAQSPCTTVNGEITSTGDSSAPLYWCLMTPEEMQVKVHYIGMCKVAPTYANFESVCEPLFSSTAGTQVTVGKNQPFSLVDEISITEGTYTHAAMFVDKTIRHKSIVTFSSPRRGKSGDPSGTNVTGKVCWSLEMTADDTSITQGDDYPNFRADCGDEVGSVGYNVSTKNVLNELEYPFGPTDTTTGTTDSTSWTVYLLDQSKQRDPDVSDGSVANAQYLLGLQQFNTPVSITANTTQVDLGFRLTNTFGVKMLDDDSAPSNKETVIRFVLGGFELIVTAN